jgi:curli biogenesis system outer membrane secretion channel CsgG
MNMSLRAGSIIAAVAVLSTGCSMLDQFTKTKTSDGSSAAIKNALGPYTGLKHAIGCKGFKNEAGWRGQWDIGSNLSIMLESALNQTERFVMVEREQLKDIIDEQDLGASGRTAKSKVAQKGLIRPARYIATGSITMADEGTSGGGGGISFGGVSLGGGGSTAKISIIAKLVDTTTGEIVKQKKIDGKAGRVGVNLGLSVKGVSTDMNSFSKTPMAEAAQDCIDQAAIFFAKEMEAMPFEGAVVKVSNGKVIINRGAEFGVQAGALLEMREDGELLTDPESGAVLGKEPGKVIGELKVVTVDQKMTICDVVSGEKKPAPGTPVYKK